MENITAIESLDAPVRAELLKQLPVKERKQMVENLVECAMRVGIMDAVDIRVWLGIKNYNLSAITASVERIKKRWLEDVDSVAQSAAMERVIQIKKVWEEIRNCEQLYEEAKSVGDKIKVKQLQLEYMKYVAKLNFVESIVDSGDSDTQINIIAGSTVKNESN